MKAVKITKGFNQLLNMLRANHMDQYMTLTEVVVQLIVGNNTELMNEILKLSTTVKENKNITTVVINNETFNALKVVQQRYKQRYNKIVPVGEILETLCTKSLRSACYRELMSNNNTEE